MHESIYVCKYISTYLYMYLCKQPCIDMYGCMYHIEIPLFLEFRYYQDSVLWYFQNSIISVFLELYNFSISGNLQDF